MISPKSSLSTSARPDSNQQPKTIVSSSGQASIQH